MTRPIRSAGFWRVWPRVQATVVAAVTLGAALGAAGCGGLAPAAEPPVAPPAAPPADGAPTRRSVKLESAQIQEVGIEELTTHAPADAIKATGTIGFNADRTAKLLPPVQGQVQQLTVNVGDTVHKNDVVFVLSSREVAAAIADHVGSHRDLELAEKTFAMTQDLFDHQAASRMSLQQSENELAKAKAKLAQTEEVLEVLGIDGEAEQDTSRLQSRIPVRSSIDGTIIERNVTNGQFVGPDNPPLITIADLSTVWVEADVFERDLRHVSAGQTADVKAEAYPDDRFSARVSRIGSVVDAQTRTAKVRFLVANSNGRLKPGMFVSVSIYLPENTSALTLPAKAVFVENRQAFAYVQVGPQEFERREVETVAIGSERVRVVHGLEAGNRVVTDGVLLLRQLEADASGS